MAIKTLNSVQPNQRRPLRISDLQDIWDGLNTALASDFDANGGERILFGFDYDESTDNYSAGLYAKGGKLYYFAGGLIDGAGMYIHDNPSDDTRTLENGNVIPFSFINVIDTISTNGTYAFTADYDIVLELKAKALSKNSVDSHAIRRSSILPSNLHPTSGVGTSFGDYKIFAPAEGSTTLEINICELIDWDVLYSDFYSTANNATVTSEANPRNIFKSIYLDNTTSDLESLIINTNPDYSLVPSHIPTSDRPYLLDGPHLPDIFIINVYKAFVEPVNDFFVEARFTRLYGLGRHDASYTLPSLGGGAYAVPIQFVRVKNAFNASEPIGSSYVPLNAISVVSTV